MIEYRGYALGQKSINGASKFSGQVRPVIENQIGRGYT